MRPGGKGGTDGEKGLNPMRRWQELALQELEEIGLRPRIVYESEVQVALDGVEYNFRDLRDVQEFADLCVLGGDLSGFKEDW